MHQRELPDQLVLRAIGVLILIHQDVLKTPVVLLADFRGFIEELHGFQQQVVKVQGVRLPQLRLIKAEERGDFFHRIVLRLLVHHLGRQAMILGVTDPREHAARRGDLLPQAQFLDAGLHQPLLIVFVINRKIAAIPQVVDVPPQHADAEGMESGNMRRARVQLHAAVQQLGHALLHLRRGFVGEGDRQDAFRWNCPGFNQVGNAVGDNARLAAARPRQDKQRPLGLFHRGALLDIELVKQIRHAGL